MESIIRKVKKKDIQALKSVLSSSGLFPPEFLEGMIQDYLINPFSTDIWLTTVNNGTPISIAYCAPEKFTKGTYNLKAIAVHKNHQGRRVGQQMIYYIEDLLRKNGCRILIIETSGKPKFSMTRAFYHKCNYRKEAVIRAFYAAEDDKVVFWKALTKK